jgi:hypothetical protein
VKATNFASLAPGQSKTKQNLKDRGRELGKVPAFLAGVKKAVWATY